MSRYALTDDGHLLVAWPTGRADRAMILGEFGRLNTEDLTRVTRALTQLAKALWTTYSEPSSAAVDAHDPDELWRREKRESAVDEVRANIASPNLPDDDGMMLTSYNPVIESAHAVGRAMHDVEDPNLLAVVAEDVDREIDAVRRAVLGDMSGRAAQAATLTRAEASPTQVEEVHRALEVNPLGSRELFEVFEPAAAAVAAAEWLHAAARVVATDCDYESPKSVVIEADAIEAMPVETMTAIISALEAGEGAQTLVTRLLREANAVAGGSLDDPSELLRTLNRVAEYAGDDLSQVGVRLCLLDPRRPAQDLLEDLIEGIRGCLLVFEDENVDVYEEEDSVEEIFLDLLRVEVRSHRPQA